MPPYYRTIMMLEKFSPKRCLPLSSVYEALLTNNFKFGGKYPVKDTENGRDYCNGLNSITCWNQERFDKNFKLGLNQNSREGYQQFLLLHPFYYHCRVITSSKHISVIVPESEITLPSFEWCEGVKSLDFKRVHPLKQLSLSVWQTGLVTSIQTAPENGGYTSYRDLIEGNLPFIFPFSVLDEICAQRIQLNSHQIIRQEINAGILLETKEAIYG